MCGKVFAILYSTYSLGFLRQGLQALDFIVVNLLSFVCIVHVIFVTAYIKFVGVFSN